MLQGYDPDKDVAVLKIEAPSEALRPIAVGESKSLKVRGKYIHKGVILQACLRAAAARSGYTHAQEYVCMYGHHIYQEKVSILLAVS